MLEAVHFSKLHIQVMHVHVNLHCWYLLASRSDIRRQTNNNNKIDQGVVQIICGINGR